MNNSHNDMLSKSPNTPHRGRPVTMPSRSQTTTDTTGKFQPATRTERMISWHQRMQLLFTRQNY